jgi:hypothetical protein
MYVHVYTGSACFIRFKFLGNISFQFLIVGDGVLVLFFKVIFCIIFYLICMTAFNFFFFLIIVRSILFDLRSFLAPARLSLRPAQVHLV